MASKPYTVKIEATVIVALILEVPAEDEMSAHRVVEKMMRRGTLKPDELVEGLIVPHRMAFEAYIETTGEPYLDYQVETDEAGFEVRGVVEKEDEK